MSWRFQHGIYAVNPLRPTSVMAEVEASPIAATANSGRRSKSPSPPPPPPSPAAAARAACQGLTLIHFSAQPKPFWSHIPVSPCVIDWGKMMHPIYPTKCAYIEPNSGRV